MAAVMRMQRGGQKKRPYYRIVVADKRAPRDGKYIEKVGTFNPMVANDNPERLVLVKERIEHWLGEGVLPSERVQKLLAKEGMAEAPSYEGKPQKARKRPDKKTRKELKTEADADAAKQAEEEAKAAAEAPAEEAPAEEAAAEEAPAEEAKEEAADAEEETKE